MVGFRPILFSVRAHAQNDFPQLKYALLGSVGLYMLIQKEQ